MANPEFGRVHINIDIAGGVVQVRVTPPFGLESSSVEATMPLLEFLDFGAHAVLAVNEAQRKAIAEFQGKRARAVDRTTGVQ